MSTVTINETFKIDGSYIEVTNVEFSNFAGTIGCIRNDTEASVITVGQDLTKTATGRYTYTFTEPVSDDAITYTYWIKWTYGGETYYDEHTVTGDVASDLVPTRNTDKYVDWVRQEFQPITLATPDATIKQMLENTIRYWNNNSAHKVTGVYEATFATTRVQLDPAFNTVVSITPLRQTSWILGNYPMFSLTGIMVLDNVTSDLILMSEAYKTYRTYLGADMSWTFNRAQNVDEGGWLYLSNLHNEAQGIFVVGTRRIQPNEDITDPYILDWVLNYTKALVKISEGNTLRKSSIINVANDGQELVSEGKSEVEELQRTLAINSRWVVTARRV